MAAWLDGALDYVASWMAFQLRCYDQPGAQVAIVHDGVLAWERAFGTADLTTAEPLTTRHRMRAASHSKSFTAAGIMKLVEAGRLRLDDPCGGYVPGLHPGISAVTIGQLLSHGGGLVRDGRDGGQFTDRIPYRNREELLADLAEAPPFEPGMRLKYSNHGYGLLGLVMESVTGQPYADWMAEHVIAAAGLTETAADTAALTEGKLAKGHSGKQPLGYRVVVPGANPTHAMAAAAGFATTASDLARFFAQLAPTAPTSLLSAASRREMSRRLWRDEDTTIERYYGYGLMSGPPGPWSYLGHTGGLQGFISRTVVIPEEHVAVSVVTNALDGLAHSWVDGILGILRRFKEAGEPKPGLADWSGRWWSIWGAVDLVPVGEQVLAAFPAAFAPFFEASEIEVTGTDEGRIAKCTGYGSPGEPVRLVRAADGTVEAIQLAASRLLPEAALAAEMRERYGACRLPGDAA